MNLKEFEIICNNDKVMSLKNDSSLEMIIVKHVNNKVEVKKNGAFYAFLTLTNNIERDVFMMVYRKLKQQNIESIQN